MISPGDGERSLEQRVNPIAIFDEFQRKQVERNAGLASVLDLAFPAIYDTENCNQLLAQAGHSELQLQQKAPMRPVASIDEFLHPNNFSMYFQMHTGFRKFPTTNHWGEPEEKSEPVPITREEFAAALSGTVKFDDMNMTHLKHPAFHRMAALFPDFAADTVAKLSAPENQHQYEQFLPEIFVAYQIMAELIDVSDPYVSDENGVINEGYLWA
jgi:hypothetical protein